MGASSLHHSPPSALPSSLSRLGKGGRLLAKPVIPKLQGDLHRAVGRLTPPPPSPRKVTQRVTASPASREGATEGDGKGSSRARRLRSGPRSPQDGKPRSRLPRPCNTRDAEHSRPASVWVPGQPLPARRRKAGGATWLLQPIKAAGTWSDLPRGSPLVVTRVSAHRTFATRANRVAAKRPPPPPRSLGAGDGRRRALGGWR